MSDEAHLFSRYSNLLSKVSSAPDFPKVQLKGKVTEIGPLIQKFKTAVPAASPVKLINAGRIALASNVIQRTSGDIISVLKTFGSTVELSGQLPPWFEAYTKILEEAKNIGSEAEKATKREDITAMTMDYFSIACEAQIIAKELEIVTKDMRGEDVEKPSTKEKVSGIIESVKNKIENFLDKLVGSARQLGEDLKSAVKNFSQKIIRLGTVALNEIAKLLKEVLDLLQKFILALIGDMFDFANWIQNIAAKKGFTIKDFNIVIPSTEITVIMVGVIPIPIPKFKTPQLSVSFATNVPS